ncbi:serine/threonine-protein kinase [Pseudomarimonas salicorniae]|uniref:non-specific serine/threonine protein kinase n=1 Tax=Pseudomarimonas salicorniae TaxID=2933270 RepID=A0ABT0GM05_9GAMM|nr:serine/threonine-protein kinase [Lysobacter sp. CAU 1642]MCK7595578.1 serine/threonine-protein kinase [Lysobacter sp. CAU 1642]
MSIEPREPVGPDASLDLLSLRVADGESSLSFDPAGLDADSRRLAGQLGRLARLRELFRLRAASAVSRLPECPFRWGRLEVLEPIGAGSFSQVFRARDPVLDRDVALKLFTDVEAPPESLISEARRHARVHHPRVLAIHGADVDGELAGLWTDLLEGSTLDARLRESGPLPQAALRRLAGDLAAGLGAVHEQGIVHGDLKPANVWIDASGRALLMDFGASVAAQQGAPARFGSPVAMAPELFEGAAPSPASDVWALGATLHVAATGRYPLERDSFAAFKQAHASRETADRRRLHEATGPLAGLIEAMLSHAPAARPSPVSVLQALDHLDRAPQRRLRRTAAALVIAALSVGVVVSLWMLQRAEAARAVAERARFEAQTSKDFLIESVRRMSPESERGLGSVRAVLDFLAESGEQALQETPLALGELEVVVGTRLTHFDAEEEGFARAHQGIQRIRDAAPEAHGALARAYNILAEAERQRGRYAESESHARQALLHIEQLPRTEEHRLQAIQVRGMLVGLLGDSGRWNEALLAQRRQLAEREALVGADDPRMAVEYNNLADPLWRLGQYQEALDAYRRALALLRSGEPKRPYPEALVTEGIAWVLMLLGRIEAAEQTLDEAESLYRAIGIEPGGDALQSVYIKRAGILRLTGDAQGAADRMRSLLEDQPSRTPQRRNGLIGLGVTCIEAGCWEESLAAFREAALTPFPEGHPENDYLQAAEAFVASLVGEAEPAAAGQALAVAMQRFERDRIAGSRRYAEMADWAGRLEGRRARADR